jgi:hypothetical protein
MPSNTSLMMSTTFIFSNTRRRLRTHNITAGMSRAADQQFALLDSPVFSSCEEPTDDIGRVALVIVAAEQADAGRCTSILLIGTSPPPSSWAAHL